MGYKALGFVIWQGVKLYVRRRSPVEPRKAAIGAIAVLALIGTAGAVAAQRPGSD